MPATYTLIASNTLTTSAASVTFSAIPGTYTDLVLRVSARQTASSTVSNFSYAFNGSTTSASYTIAYGDGSSAFSSRGSAATDIYAPYISGATATANTFGSAEVYIPNYAGSSNKVGGSFTVAEGDIVGMRLGIGAGLWSNTAAITSIELDGTFAGGTAFASGSSFFLYGIKNS